MTKKRRYNRWDEIPDEWWKCLMRNTAIHLGPLTLKEEDGIRERTTSGKPIRIHKEGNVEYQLYHEGTVIIYDRTEGSESASYSILVVDYESS